jgi:hypothetical protein
MTVRGQIYLAAVFISMSTLCAAAESPAGLTCEQIFAVAQTALRYRDQGYTLNQVLAEMRGVNAEGKLTAAELDTLRRAITLAYIGNASPEEIALECISVRDRSTP